MRAIPTGLRVRTGPARGAAVVAVLITAAACTSATATMSASSSPGRSSGASTARGGGLVVTTAGGAVRGKAVAATDEFLGIPYAAPPVGALRWRPPQPPAPWHGVRAATSFAAALRRSRHRRSAWPARPRTAST